MTVLPPSTSPTGYLARVPTELRRDLVTDRRKIILVLAVLAGFGVVVGVIWGLWAPRDHYQTVTGGYLLTNLDTESRVGGDVVLLMMLLGVAIVAFVVLWLRGPRRGVLSLVTLAIGVLVMGLVAWGVGGLVTSKPTEHQLQTKGAEFAIDQRLHMFAVLLMPVIVVVVLYVIVSIFSGDDELHRRTDRPNFVKGRQSAQRPPEDSAIPAGMPLRGSAMPPAEPVDRHQIERPIEPGAHSSEA